MLLARIRQCFFRSLHSCPRTGQQRVVVTQRFGGYFFFNKLFRSLSESGQGHIGPACIHHLRICPQARGAFFQQIIPGQQQIGSCDITCAMLFLHQGDKALCFILISCRQREMFFGH